MDGDIYLYSRMEYLWISNSISISFVKYNGMVACIQRPGVVAKWNK